MEVLKRINRELVKKCHVFSLYQDTVELPDGRIDDYDFIGHKGAAAVVPVTQEGRILMVKQYRNPLDRVCRREEETAWMSRFRTVRQGNWRKKQVIIPIIWKS